MFRTALFIGAVAAVIAGGCALKTFGNFPGKTCQDSASHGMVAVNYESYRERLAAQTPSVTRPAFEDIEQSTEIPLAADSPHRGRIYCMGLATFEDGSTEGVYYSWVRDYKINAVSGPGFRWCMGQADRRCGRAIPPGYADQ